jgi:uncharacterized protein YdhG (YjbR/CyaY superfamily)
MNMFKVTDAKNPQEYIAKIDEPRKSEIQKLHDLIREYAPKLEPFMISGMIGYGKYHYKYPSGREGDWCTIALASQKNYISVYVCVMNGEQYLAERYKSELPKASIGKSCIRFKKTADIDLEILKEIIKKSASLPPMGAV